MLGNTPFLIFAVLVVSRTMCFRNTKIGRKVVHLRPKGHSKVKFTWPNNAESESELQTW